MGQYVWSTEGKMCVKKADRIYVMPEAAKKKMQQAKKKKSKTCINSWRK